MTRTHAWLLAALALPVPCNVLDIHGDSYLGTGHVTVTSRTGPAILECRAQLPEAPGSQMTWDYASRGIWCAAGRASTIDWAEVITPDGVAVLRCRLPRDAQ